MSARQKIGQDFSNKVDTRKNVFNEKQSPKLIFTNAMQKKSKKIPSIFNINN